jgi:predicted transcriptional regulator
MDGEKWRSVKEYLSKAWDNPSAYPDEALLLSLSQEEISSAFTKKRLELVKIIQEKKPATVTELSRLAGRKLTAVLRDLYLLEKFQIVKMEKKGKNIAPQIAKSVIIIPLAKIEAKELARTIAR